MYCKRRVCQFPDIYLPLLTRICNVCELSGDIYEHAVLLSVKTEDQDAFERDFFQLKHYYTDVR